MTSRLLSTTPALPFTCYLHVDPSSENRAILESMEITLDEQKRLVEYKPEETGDRSQCRHCDKYYRNIADTGPVLAVSIDYKYWYCVPCFRWAMRISDPGIKSWVLGGILCDKECKSNILLHPYVRLCDECKLRPQNIGYQNRFYKVGHDLKFTHNPGDLKIGPIWLTHSELETVIERDVHGTRMKVGVCGYSDTIHLFYYVEDDPKRILQHCGVCLKGEIDRQQRNGDGSIPPGVQKQLRKDNSLLIGFILIAASAVYFSFGTHTGGGNFCFSFYALAGLFLLYQKLC